MEEQNQVEQAPEETVEGSEDKVLSEQSISNVTKSDEEKVNEIAANLVKSAIESNNGNAITLEDQEKLLERTKRQVKAERQKALQVLTEAEEELKNLQWNDLVPAIMNSNVRGVQARYIIHFGNFVQAINGWIYRPTGQQMLSVVKRYKNKKGCEQAATSLRERLKPIELGPTGKYSGTIIETEFMKQLKADLSEQINQLRESV